MLAQFVSISNSIDSIPIIPQSFWTYDWGPGIFEGLNEVLPSIRRRHGHTRPKLGPKVLIWHDVFMFFSLAFFAVKICFSLLWLSCCILGLVGFKHLHSLCSK